MLNYFKPFWLPLIATMALLLISIRFGNVWLPYRDVLLVLPYVLFAAIGLISLYLLQYAFTYTAILFVAFLGLGSLFLT